VIKNALYFSYYKSLKTWYYYYMEWKGQAGCGGGEYGFGSHFLSSASFLEFRRAIVENKSAGQYVY